jgi:hypothetical protein
MIDRLGAIISEIRKRSAGGSMTSPQGTWRNKPARSLLLTTYFDAALPLFANRNSTRSRLQPSLRPSVLEDEAKVQLRSAPQKYAPRTNLPEWSTLKADDAELRGSILAQICSLDRADTSLLTGLRSSDDALALDRRYRSAVAKQWRVNRFVFGLRARGRRKRSSTSHRGALVESSSNTSMRKVVASRPGSQAGAARQSFYLTH